MLHYQLRRAVKLLPCIIHDIPLDVDDKWQIVVSNTNLGHYYCSNILMLCRRLLDVDWTVLPWVRFLVVHHLDKPEVASSKSTTKKRSDPVEPVITRKVSATDSAAKRPYWI